MLTPSETVESTFSTAFDVPDGFLDVDRDGLLDLLRLHAGVHGHNGEFVRPGFGKHFPRECRAAIEHDHHDHVHQHGVFDAETGDGHDVGIILKHICRKRRFWFWREAVCQLIIDNYFLFAHLSFEFQAEIINIVRLLP